MTRVADDGGSPAGVNDRSMELHPQWREGVARAAGRGLPCLCPEVTPDETTRAAVASLIAGEGTAARYPCRPEHHLVPADTMASALQPAMARIPALA